MLVCYLLKLFSEINKLKTHINRIIRIIIFQVFNNKQDTSEFNLNQNTVLQGQSVLGC